VAALYANLENTGNIQLLVRNVDGVNSCGPPSSAFRPQFRIVNDSEEPLPLDELSVKMYFRNVTVPGRVSARRRRARTKRCPPTRVARRPRAAFAAVEPRPRVSPTKRAPSSLRAASSRPADLQM
jgi:hypothetical protein